MVIQPHDTVRLAAKFRDSNGDPVDLDSFPTVTVISPNGSINVGPTSSGVMRTDIGSYSFDFFVGQYPTIGVWRDVWQGSLEGFDVFGEFTFQVNTTQLPATNTDGYHHLGDDPGFCYSQNAICNINLLLKSLRARLNSAGKTRKRDEFGNVTYHDCDIYSTDDLVSFLAMALSEFNYVPHFTEFTFEDTPIIELFHTVLVQGATLFALSSQALIERGREFQVQDNGIGFTPPTVSELLSTQWNTELSNWWEKVKLVKHNMKPSPLGFSGYGGVLGTSPQVRRLRWLRERQVR
jgi:hypothetical protein